MGSPLVQAHLYDVGVEVEVQFVWDDPSSPPGRLSPYDVSDADELRVYVERPDGAVFLRPGRIVSDGSDGRVRYVSLAGDLSQRGTWKVQGWSRRGAEYLASDVTTFEVAYNLFIGLYAPGATARLGVRILPVVPVP